MHFSCVVSSGHLFNPVKGRQRMSGTNVVMASLIITVLLVPVIPVLTFFAADSSGYEGAHYGLVSASRSST